MREIATSPCWSQWVPKATLDTSCNRTNTTLIAFDWQSMTSYYTLMLFGDLYISSGTVAELNKWWKSAETIQIFEPIIINLLKIKTLRMHSFLKHKVFCYFGTTMPYGRCIIPNKRNRNKSWLTERTVWRVASHVVIIVLCTMLDAECDSQATVVGRLLTTLGDVPSRNCS